MADRAHDLPADEDARGLPGFPECSGWRHPASVLGLRIQPREDVIEVVAEVIAATGVAGAAIVSAAGSLERIVYALAVREFGRTTYGDPHYHDGAIELLSLGGHFGRADDGTVAAHVHGAFALSDGTVVGGHVFEARTLATLEITLLAAEGLAWHGQAAHHPTAPGPTHMMIPSGPPSGATGPADPS